MREIFLVLGVTVYLFSVDVQAAEANCIKIDDELTICTVDDGNGGEREIEVYTDKGE